MALGTVQQILVCGNGSTPVLTGGRTISCSDGTSVGMMQAYVLDPSAAGYMEAAMGPFDYAQGASFFGFGFVGVASIYLLSHGIGLILKTVRDA